MTTSHRRIKARPPGKPLRRFSSEMEFIRHALDSAAIVAMTDVKGTITFVNGKFCEISGYTQAELIGSNHRMLQSGIHDVIFFRNMYRQISRGQVWHGELCNRRKDGSHYWVDTTIVPHVNAVGRVDSYTAIRFDISSRIQAEEQLRRAVSTDHLTGIPNRRSFQAELEAALHDADRTAGQVYLALLDIDSFKEINDAFGHDVGDHLLQIVAHRLNGFAGPTCFVARLGGDEFGLIIREHDEPGVQGLIDDILMALRRPMLLAGTLRRSSVSIGLASYSVHARSLEELFKAADLALYRAKSLGRDRSKWFVSSMREAVERRAELLAAIESGLAANQFSLHYQPIVPTTPDCAPAVEALLRWQHPDLGLIAPGVFLHDIEDPGVCAVIGQFVLERVCRDMRTFLDAGLPIDRVSINVTNADFRSDDFADSFFSLSRQFEISPTRFCIEVTEGVFLGRDFQHVERRLTRLHDAGVEIALDDFGTGFASLTHLRQMPIDRIKIDRSFVANLPASSQDCAIVRGVVDIAQSLGKSVTAEGVETSAQAHLLAELGCDHLQGWLFAKALPPAELADALLALVSRERPASAAVASRRA